MKLDNDTHDVLSVSVVAVVAIVCVALIVLNLAPGVVAAERVLAAHATASGKAVDYDTTCRPVGTQFDYAWLDFNDDGRLDYYDYQDVLDGTVDCLDHQCDLTQDGAIDNQDLVAFNRLVTELYDYDGDGEHTRRDPLFLRTVLYGDDACDADHVCDLTGDGLVCNDDLAAYTSFVYNYDTSQNVGGKTYLWND